MIQIDITQNKIDAFTSVGEGWALIRDQYLLFVVISLIFILLTSIPFAGLLLQGPLTCGYYFCLLAKMRGERVHLGMIFLGFNALIPSIIIWIVSFAPLRLFSTSEVSVAITSAISQSFPPIVAVPLVIGFFLIGIAWGIGMSFAYPLLVDYKVTVGEAIRLSLIGAFKNVWGLIRVGLVLSVLVLAAVVPFVILLTIGAGLLALVIFYLQLLLMFPLFLAPMVIVYKQVFSVESATLNGDSILQKSSILNLQGYGVRAKRLDSTSDLTDPPETDADGAEQRN